MAGGTLRNPLLAEHMWQRRRGSTESIAGKILAATSGTRGRSYAQQRTLARRQSITDRRELESASVSTILSCLASPFIQFYKRFIDELNYISLPAKAGLAASLCSILCFVPGPLSFLNKNGMWAVITADVCLGANVGLTLYKGLNRTLGTMAAAGVALLVDYLAPKCGAYEPYFLIFWTFLGAALPMMFKFRRRFKDRWNYAVAMAMVTFHILILSNSEYSDKVKLPMIRMITILIGFCTASLVNLCVVPTYAGDLVSELVAKNFERAGNMMESCVIAYCDAMVLERVPDILAGRSEDDNIHTSFHEILSADAEVDKLLKAVPYEPCHGKFFRGYPWHLYQCITEVLRDALYDVAALDSCLRAEIQAPPHIRHIFEEEFESIGRECAQVFRMIGESIRQMKHVNCLHRIHQAEEGALLLQHKIVKYMSGVISVNGIVEKSLEAGEAQCAYEESIADAFRDAFEDHTFTLAESYFGAQEPPVERSDIDSSIDGFKFKDPHLAKEHHDFLRRRESMSRHWITAVQRISVLSLVKFAAIMIELVAKAKSVTTIVDELEVQARFEEDEESNFASKNLRENRHV